MEGPRFLDEPSPPVAASPVEAPISQNNKRQVTSSETTVAPSALEPNGAEGPRFLDEPPNTARGSASSNPSISEDPDRAMAPRGWIEGVVGREGPIRHNDPAPLRVLSSERPALVVGAIALLILLVGLSVLQLANFVVDQFARAAWLGFVTIAILSPAIAVLAWSFIREWRGYAVLGQIDAVRSGLADQDISVVRERAESWLSSIGASEETRRVVNKASDSMTLRELLRAGPLTETHERAKAAGSTAALQILGATAASPWPGFDGVLVVWRSLRLIREIAQLYGHRPGVVGTLALFRRVALDAGAVAATEVAVSSATEALLNSPLAGGLAGQAAGGAVAARRMIRLAHATATTCSPL